MRTTISVPPGLMAKARKVMEVLDYPDLSGYTQELYRADYEFRFGKIRRNLRRFTKKTKARKRGGDLSAANSSH